MVLPEVKYSGGKLKWSEKKTNEVLNNILCQKANWIGHILRRNCLLYDIIEGQMTEVEGVGRTQLLDD